MKFNAQRLGLVIFALCSFVISEALPQNALAKRQILGGAGIGGDGSSATDSSANGNGNSATGGGGAQSTTKAQQTTSQDQNSPTSRDDGQTSTQQQQTQQTTQQQATTTQQAPSTTFVQPTTSSTSQLVAPSTTISSVKTTSSLAISSSLARSSSAALSSSLARPSSILLPSSSLFLSSSSLSASASPSASIAPDTSNTSTTSGLAKKTIIIIIVVASVIGLAFGAWTIIRKTKLGPSARFEEKLQPIDWSPRAGENDAVYLKEMNSENDTSSMADKSTSPPHDEYYPYLGRSPSGRTLHDQSGQMSYSGHGETPYDMANVGHERMMSLQSGHDQSMMNGQAAMHHDVGGLPYDNEPSQPLERSNTLHQGYTGYPTMNPSDYGGAGTYQSYMNTYQSQDGGMPQGTQYGYDNYYEVPYTGHLNNGGGSMYGRGPRSGGQSFGEGRSASGGAMI